MFVNTFCIPPRTPIRSRNTTPTPISKNIQLLKPRRNPSTQYSTRLSITHRRKFSKANLIIINFEGVLGDLFSRKAAAKKRPRSFYMRPNWIEGVRNLQQRFRVVVFFGRNDFLIAKALSYFDEHKVQFDGVYRTEEQWDWRQDYRSVMLDFDVQKRNQVLVLSPLRSSDYSIYSRTVSADKRINCLRLSTNLPTLLIPDPRNHEKRRAITFDLIANFILASTIKIKKDFYDMYDMESDLLMKLKLDISKYDSKEILYTKFEKLCEGNRSKILILTADKWHTSPYCRIKQSKNDRTLDLLKKHKIFDRRIAVGTRRPSPF